MIGNQTNAAAQMGFSAMLPARFALILGDEPLYEISHGRDVVDQSDSLPSRPKIAPWAQIRLDSSLRIRSDRVNVESTILQ